MTTPTNTTPDYPVVLWIDANFLNGQAVAGYGNYSSMTLLNMPNGKLSSIKIAPFTKVRLYSQQNFLGDMLELVGATMVANLTTLGFNDKTNSLQVIYVPPTLAEQVACCRGQSTGQCGAWVAGSQACDNTFLQYCAGTTNGVSNMDAPCKAWASQNTAIADPLVINYCKSHPTDPFCYCINSPAQSKQIMNPKCIDANCIKYGYQTTSMQQAPCPNIITCNMQVDLANAGTQLGNSIQLEQGCGNNGTTTGGGAPLYNSPTSAGLGQPTQSTITTYAGTPPVQKTNWLVFVFFFFIIVIAFVVILGLFDIIPMF